MDPHPETSLNKPRQKWLLITIVVVLLIYLVATIVLLVNNPYLALEEARLSQASLEEEMTNLEGQLEMLEEEFYDVHTNFATLVTAYDALDDLNDDLTEENETITEEHQLLQSSYIDLTEANQALVEEQEELKQDYEALTSDHETLTNQHESLISMYSDLSEKYDALTTEHTWLQDRAITPPYIHINGRKVYLAFNKSDESFILWEVPFDRLEYDLQRGHDARSNPENGIIERITLTSEETGDKYSVMDFRPFTDPDAFKRVIADLYGEAESDDAFIREVWHIVTQLTAYSSEITETPRYPLETFLAGGGDCEDTSILFASMIQAAPVDWRVEFTYMDIHNPNDPQAVNHLIVFVDTGERKYFVETTGKKNMEPYQDGVMGWYLPLDDR